MQNKWRFRLLWAGGVLILLGTFALVQTYRHSFPTEPVLVAVRDLPPGVALQPADVRVERVSPGTAPKGSLKNPEQLKDQWIAAGLLAGDFVTVSHLRAQPPSTLDRPEEGKVILSIPINPADVLAGVLSPGDVVAIWLTDAPLGKEAQVHALPGEAVVVDVRNSAGETTQAEAPKGGGLNAAGPSNLVPAWVVLKLPVDNSTALFKAVAQKQGIHFVLLKRGGTQP